MACKCRICGVNDVEHEGDVCELCAIGQDPYASAMQSNSTRKIVLDYAEPLNEKESGYGTGSGRTRKVLLGGGGSLVNTDPYGNSIVPETDDPVQVYQAGQVPVSSQGQTTVDPGNTKTGGAHAGKAASKGNQPICSGITKNISVDTQKKSFIGKWFRALFSGIPISLDDDITMFQVFPDYSGSALNALGNACDQVIVYGKVNSGAVAENNDVEIYGYRDSNNNVIAKMIKNKASGTTIRPDRTIPAAVAWVITLIVFGLLFCISTAFGTGGIVWAVIIVLCLTGLPFILKILAVLFGIFFTRKK
ncbi:MAG: DUF5336 domain-containing protein [Dorea sp.]